jgi:DNA invertase Pin-like site-specific DNA recombinase
MKPRHPNDRLLLGMKGTMSELELSLLRARSMEALKQKARRGELFFTVAVGYVKVGREKIEMDPDLRVREAIGLVFTRFAEMQSIRQVFLSLQGDQIALPYINSKSSWRENVSSRNKNGGFVRPPTLACGNTPDALHSAFQNPSAVMC